MEWVIIVSAIVILILVACILLLRTEDLSHHEHPVDPVLYPRSEPTNGHHVAIGILKKMNKVIESGSKKDKLRAIRFEMDKLGDNKEGDCRIISDTADGIPGEWVIAPDSDPRRRLLYLHGGAFMMGSPKSHRAITRQLSERLKVVVFVPDYRLMPEYKRLDCFTDCQKAYHWILCNGPFGKTGLDELIVAGDSAGGCLTLTTIAWARNEKLRQADAAVALSPFTDLTFSGKTIETNAKSDLMLKSLLGHIHKVPKFIILLTAWLANKVHPTNPVVSPVMGDLSSLPPTLIQASDSEMLLSDGRRYVNKAKSQGSEIKLQTWPHMLHVWHIFAPELTEANEAFNEIFCFIEEIRSN